jgi:hypothetical protein
MIPPLLREPDAQDLRAHLDEVGPEVAPVVDRLWEPVELLRALHREASAALRNDALAVLRVRLLLRVEWPWSILGAALLRPAGEGDKDTPSTVLLAAYALGGEDRTTAFALTRDSAFAGSASLTVSSALAPPDPFAAAPDLVRPAALAVLALLATRCAEGSAEAARFLATVLGFAIGAGPVEVLARTEPPGAGPAVLRSWLLALDAQAGDRTGAAAFGRIVPLLASDANEVRRWRRVAAIGTLIRTTLARDGFGFPEGATRSLWEAAWSDTVLDVLVDPGGTALDVTTSGDGERPAEAHFAITLGRPDGAPLLREIPFARAPEGDVTYAVDAAGPGVGWAGLTSDPEAARAAEWRTRLLAQLLEHQRASGVPVEVTAELIRAIPRTEAGSAGSPGFLRCPPITDRNRYRVLPVVTVRSFAATPTHARPGEPVALTWDVQGAEQVRVEAGTTASAAGAALVLGSWSTSTATWTPPAAGRFVLTLRPVVDGLALHSPTADATVDVGPWASLTSLRIDGHDVLTASTAAAGVVRVRPRFTVAVTVRADADADTTVEVTFGGERRTGAGPTFETSFGNVPRGDAPLGVAVHEGEVLVDARTVPLRVEGVGMRTLVLLLPRVCPPGPDAAPPAGVAEAAARADLAALAAPLGLDLDLRLLPVIPWALAAVPHVPGPDDGLLAELFDNLDALTVHSPGGEDATWLILLPGEAPERHPQCAQLLTGVASRRLAIATSDQLPTLLAAMAADAGAGGEPRRCLRIEAEVAGNGAFALRGIREEIRVVPRRPPGAGDIQVSLMDAGGATRGRLTLPTPGPAGAIRLLLPLGPDVAALEFGRRQRVLASARQPAPGTGERVDTSSLPTLAWHAEHPEGIRPVPHVEVSADAPAGIARPAIWTPLVTLDPCRGQGPLPLRRLQRASTARVALSDGWNAPIPADPFPVAAAKTWVVARRLRDGRWWAETNAVEATFRWVFGDRPVGTTPIVTLPAQRAGLLRVDVIDHTGGTATDFHEVQLPGWGAPMPIGDDE